VTVPVRAVTFDFWNTLMCEGPAGLVAPRVAAWMGILEEAGSPIEQGRIEAAHAHAFEGYQAAWKANEQYRVAEATIAMLEHLDLRLSDAVRAALVDAFAAAGRVTELRLCAGVDACLRALHDRGVALSIVCDIGLTPSPALRDQLDRRGLLQLFGSWAFSDEVGVYKPDPAIFRHALEPLGVAPEEAAHVGDRLRTDVGGALALGMTAVRYTGVYDDTDEGPEAQHVIGDYRDLLPALGLADAP
jgi:putative hydrolase of the HAD superfamily